MLLATQFPDQLEDGVRKEVINNTSVKLAGPMANSVVAQVNRDMRCEQDFILNMKKVDFSHADWACYIDNVTQNAVRLRVPFGAIEKLPMIKERLRTSRRNAPPQNAQSPPEEALRATQQQSPEGDAPTIPPDPQPKQHPAEPSDLPTETEY